MRISNGTNQTITHLGVMFEPGSSKKLADDLAARFVGTPLPAGLSADMNFPTNVPVAPGPGYSVPSAIEGRAPGQAPVPLPGGAVGQTGITTHGDLHRGIVGQPGTNDIPNQKALMDDFERRLSALEERSGVVHDAAVKASKVEPTKIDPKDVKHIDETDTHGRSKRS
jgi:hypothetical protein